MLIEQGVSIDEMKLYGETETDDALDESLCKDSFAELEAVVSKVGNDCDIITFSLLSIYVFDYLVTIMCSTVKIHVTQSTLKHMEKDY